jgi:hypothetical protein
MEQKQKGILIGMLTLVGILVLILFSGYYNQVKTLKQEIETLKQRNYNDSILVSEYQEAFHIFFDKSKISAEEFSKILDSLNRK